MEIPIDPKKVNVHVATCQYCGNQFMALYEKQCQEQKNVHELHCPVREQKGKEVKMKPKNNQDPLFFTNNLNKLKEATKNGRRI